VNTETRTIRPFVGIESFAKILDESLLHVGADTCLSRRSIEIEAEPHAFLLRPVVLEWATDEEAFGRFLHDLGEHTERAGFADGDLGIGVVARSSFLRRAEVLYDCPIERTMSLGRRIDLTAPARPRSLAAPHNGFVVEAYVLLRRRLEPQPLRPHLKGTWLARTRFTVGARQSQAFPPPAPLTKAVRDELGLPAKTMRYLHIGDHDVLAPYAEQAERPVLYVDDGLLAHLNARRRSPASRAVQLQLALDYLVGIVDAARSHERIGEVTYDDVRTSLLGSVVRIAAGAGASPAVRESVVVQVRSRPAKVVARLEHAVDALAAYGDLMKDNGS
jgi:hypothetical protein